MSNAIVSDLTNATALSERNKPQKAKNTELGKDDFLKLLMTQLSAQDPLNPMDSTQFVAQLSQFASLEQLTNMGSKFDDLITLQNASHSAMSVSLLGKEIVVDGNEIHGSGTVFYRLETNARSAAIEVRNEQGEVVKFIDNLATDTGPHEVKIEGLPPGKYTFRVAAEDFKGQEIRAAVAHAERVAGVSFAGTVPLLLTETGGEFPASQIVEIREPSPAQGGAPNG